MFKMFKIRVLALLIVIIGLVLVACDGRYRKYRENAEVLKAHKQLEVFSNREYFIPEQSVSIKTDTIFKSGFQVKINYHSLEDKVVSVPQKSIDNLNITKHYKRFEADLVVLKDDALVIKDVINSDFLYEFDFNAPENLKGAIMQHLWIDQYASNEEKLYLNTSFLIPKTGHYKDYTLIIDEMGKIELKPLTEQQKISKNYART